VITAAPLVIATLLVAYVWYLTRQTVRFREELAEERAAAYREWRNLLTKQAEERAEWARERADLLQRIQAPEQAVQQHVVEQRPERRRPRVIAADDDAAFRAMREERDGVAREEPNGSGD